MFARYKLLQRWDGDNNLLDCKLAIMGNSVECAGIDRTQLSNHAYGKFEIAEIQGQIRAIVRKSTQKSSNLQQRLEMQLQTRKRLNCPNLVRLLHYHLEESNLLILIALEYEYFPTTLRTKAKQYQAQNQQFSPQMLSNLMKGVEAGLTALYEAGIHHGCISMDSILYDEGVYKITDVSSTTYLTAFELLRKGDRGQALSQKVLALFNDGKLKNRLLQQLEIQDDLFSLGIIVLSIIGKVSIEEFYSYSQVQENQVYAAVNYPAIDLYLRLARRKFGQQLAGRIEKLLIINRKASLKDVAETSVTYEDIPRQQRTGRTAKTEIKIAPPAEKEYIVLRDQSLAQDS